MNSAATSPLDPAAARTAETSPSAPARPAPVLPPPRVGRGSPVRQTVLVVGVLLLGLVAALAILRSAKKAPAGEAREEPAAGVESKGKDAHGHGGHGEGGHAEKGRVELTPEKLKNANLGLEAAGGAKIHVNLRVFGKIGPDEERLAHVSPRFAGIAKKVNKRLGERVAAGEVLAVVESNESLQSYDVKAPLAGTIIERGVSVGEFVGTDKSLFTVADLGMVWVDFQIYQQDFPRLAVGQKVRITTNARAVPPPAATPPPLAERPGATATISGAGANPSSSGNAASPGGVLSEIAYLSPFGAENTQTMLARAHVPNAAGRLRPGLFVTGEVAVDEVDAPVAVREAAVQTMDGKDVVFVEEGDGFEARTVELGQRDGEWAEILSGVLPGERYVATNSFILKAEIGKEGAAHED